MTAQLFSVRAFDGTYSVMREDAHRTGRDLRLVKGGFPSRGAAYAFAAKYAKKNQLKLSIEFVRE